MVLKKFFLTGGSGTLGREMLENQHDYKIEFTSPSSADCDVRNYEAIYEKVNNSGCCTVVHCAAMTDVKEIELDAILACDINVVGTLNIIKVCQELNKKLVFTYSMKMSQW